MVEMTSKPNLGSDYPSDWKQLFVGDLISITTGSRNTQDNNPEGLFPCVLGHEGAGIVESVGE